MKRLMIFSVLLAIALNTFAWGPKGHRIVAQVAYDLLSNKTRKQVDAVLGTRGMVYLSTWPDEIKSDTIYPTSFTCHYQDLAGGMSDEAVVATLSDYPEEGGDLWMAIDSLKTVLKSNKKCHDGLVFFVHLYADRFCPMHVAHLDDQGGNKVKMKWFGQNTNLHTVWDSKLIESQGWSYTEYAYMLECRYGHLKKEIRQKNRSELLLENYRLVDYIYTYQETWRGNTYHYIYRWREPVELQLYTAGIRLAMLLNDIY